MKKKLLALSLAAAMCFSATGCAVNLSVGGPKTASDVIEKYAEKMEEEVNYHADMDMEFEIGAKGDGMSIELPILMSMSVDVLDENLHGDMTMEMSFMGQEMKEKSEIYVESGKRSTKTYSYSDSDGYWTVTEEDRGADIASGFSDMDSKAFENAELEVDKKAGTYTITQTFGDFAETAELYEKLEDVYGDMASMMSMDPDDFLDEWEDAEVIYVFDKDFYLTSVEITGCEFSDTIKEDGVSLDVTVSLSLSYEFSDFGKITESDVEVPDDVADKAVPSVSMELGEDNYNVTINGESHGNLDEDIRGEDEPIVNEEPEDIDYGGPASEDEGEELDPGFSVTPIVSGDTKGSYGGIALSGLGDSWDQTFGADGWEFDANDGEYSFMTAENSKYKGAELYVYNSSRNATTKADITERGVYGYSIDCAWLEGGNYPVMTWGGITFGATADEVQSTYGSPDYSYESSMYTTYEYDVADDFELTFYVYPDGGLKRVELAYYGGL